MTTELEEQFYKCFGIEPFCDLPCNKRGVECTDNTYCGNKYPDITAEKLLEMICIYNSFQNDEASLFIPFDINNVKDIALQVITKSIKDKSLNNYYCNDVEKLKTQIQQLFKEGE